MKTEITVAEYSKQYNVSKKTTYQRIKKKKLQVVYKKINNKETAYIVIDTSPEPETVDQVINPIDGNLPPEINPINPSTVPEPETVDQVINPIDGNLPPEINPINPSTVPKPEEQTSTRELELLGKIKELEETIKEKDKQIIELANRFADLADKAINTTGQAQLLHAIDKQQVVEDPIPEEPIIEEQKPQPEEKKKKSFWYRLFGFDD